MGGGKNELWLIAVEDKVIEPFRKDSRTSKGGPRDVRKVEISHDD